MLSAVLLSGMSVLTLVTVLLSFNSIIFLGYCSCSRLSAVFASSVPSLFMYISNGHFYLAVLGPGVLTDVIASVTSLHDYMMLICITICRTQQTSLLTTTVSSSHRKEGLQKHRCRPCVKNRLTYMQNFCVDLQSNFCTEFLFVFRTYHMFVCMHRSRSQPVLQG